MTNETENARVLRLEHEVNELQIGLNIYLAALLSLVFFITVLYCKVFR